MMLCNSIIETGDRCMCTILAASCRHYSTQSEPPTTLSYQINVKTNEKETKKQRKIILVTIYTHTHTHTHTHGAREPNKLFLGYNMTFPVNHSFLQVYILGETK